MSSTDSEEITDEALASSISDDGRLSSEAFEPGEEGIVEAGIPPQSTDPKDSEELNEEPFSVGDFDADMVIEEKPSVTQTPDDSPVDLETRVAVTKNMPSTSSLSGEDTSNNLPAGEVAEFRKTLSALSRQLEVDRLTFLYQQLQADGNELPALDRIASDIRGDSPLHPLGDQDLYSTRPLSRLQGWISGLSFGVGRRAKKFSR
ncbi:MAG: hypothetical protein P8P90_07435 [Opitutales bacterium]|nr:hypothetical protein [Opitutales bacterium]